MDFRFNNMMLDKECVSSFEKFHDDFSFHNIYIEKVSQICINNWSYLTSTNLQNEMLFAEKEIFTINNDYIIYNNIFYDIFAKR